MYGSDGSHCTLPCVTQGDTPTVDDSDDIKALAPDGIVSKNVRRSRFGQQFSGQPTSPSTMDDFYIARTWYSIKFKSISLWAVQWWSARHQIGGGALGVRQLWRISPHWCLAKA
ncbi:uncharacterized protein MEPE_02749 [Melanopsichium pennsylvanicum]|uniref:Uncharacterized protein n=1 Tax=Melanopsichium pennsylvanicum TaxID=63383 RepID=A0AAJ4XLP1_9BASI|nr:uncharacterized protein MEPE_02749 [Melanopsichium pennsylvanicum]